MESIIIGSMAVSVMLALPIIAVAGLMLLAAKRERVYVRAEKERMIDQMRIARGGRRH
jgi:hypothetical protein